MTENVDGPNLSSAGATPFLHRARIRTCHHGETGARSFLPFFCKSPLGPGEHGSGSTGAIVLPTGI